MILLAGLTWCRRAPCDTQLVFEWQLFWTCYKHGGRYVPLCLTHVFRQQPGAFIAKTIRDYQNLSLLDLPLVAVFCWSFHWRWRDHMSTTFRHPKNLKEHGNGNVFERAKSVRSFVFVGYAKLGLYNKPLSFHGYMVGPRSLPQAVTKAKVLGSCFSRTCHHMSSLFTWRQCDQESILCDLLW